MSARDCISPAVNPVAMGDHMAFPFLVLCFDQTTQPCPVESLSPRSCDHSKLCQNVFDFKIAETITDANCYYPGHLTEVEESESYVLVDSRFQLTRASPVKGLLSSNQFIVPHIPNPWFRRVGRPRECNEPAIQKNSRQGTISKGILTSLPLGTIIDSRNRLWNVPSSFPSAGEPCQVDSRVRVLVDVRGWLSSEWIFLLISIVVNYRQLTLRMVLWKGGLLASRSWPSASKGASDVSCPPHPPSP